jgi:hypothetical protein
MATRGSQLHFKQSGLAPLHANGSIEFDFFKICNRIWGIWTSEKQVRKSPLPHQTALNPVWNLHPEPKGTG